MGRLQDKSIVITGGGSGIGRAAALAWCDEGAKLTVTDISEKRAVDVASEVKAKGGQAIGVKLDVTSEADTEAAVAAAVAAFGRLDVMFANAGIPVEGFGTVPLEQITEEQWDRVNNVVYKGVFFSGKYAARQFIKQGGGGNIVVTTSAGGLNAYPNFGPYCAGKAGAVGLVKSMALDWGKHGIRVNSIAPTHGASANFAQDPEAAVLGLSYEEAAVRAAGGTWDANTMFAGPLKLSRPPSLYDNVAVATFLASDESMYMSGITIASCDGGNFSRTSINTGG